MAASIVAREGAFDNSPDKSQDNSPDKSQDTSPDKPGQQPGQ
ncbi:hypothetical protein [Streptomyces sp. 7N604]